MSAVRTQKNEVAPVVTLAANMSYLPFGPLASMDFGNGLALALGYDQDYRLTEIMTTNGGTNWVQDLALGYDANDHVTAIADGLDPGKSQAFAYDELWRLEQAAGPYGAIGYAYDANGNRLARTVTGGPGGSESYAYAAFSNRLLVGQRRRHPAQLRLHRRRPGDRRRPRRRRLHPRLRRREPAGAGRERRHARGGLRLRRLRPPRLQGPRRHGQRRTTTTTRTAACSPRARPPASRIGSTSGCRWTSQEAMPHLGRCRWRRSATPAPPARACTTCTPTTSAPRSQ